MGYPVSLAFRYLGSKKRSFVSIGTVFAMLGVTLGVAALTIVMSVTGGFQEQFRDKVLGVNAHVLVLKYSIDFREYREVMKKVEHVKGAVPMMVTHGERTATGVLLKGVDPEQMPHVLDLPKHIVEGSMEGLRRAGAKPPARALDKGADFGTTTGDLFPSPRADAHPGSEAPPDGSEAAASAHEVTDAGRVSLLEAIQKQIEEDDRKSRSAAANGFDAATTSAANAAVAPGTEGEAGTVAVTPGSPVGSVTPQGGFASTLPDDDMLPEAVDPDPCRSPAQIARLPGAVLGRTLARQLDVTIGDCVQITSPTIGTAFGAGSRPPVAKQFRVIALFEAGFDQYDSKLVYTDLYEAQDFYEYGDSVTGIEMKVDDIDNARAVAREIDTLLANPIYHTMDWQELNHGLFTALLIQKLGMSFVLALMIVVAAFTVIATLIMMVLDKKREISVLKALGAKNDAVLRIFLYQGGIIGLSGTLVGLVLGYFGSKGLAAFGFPLDPKVYFISKLPVTIRPLEFALAGVFAVLVCLVATIFPAMYAARLRPSDGLRAE